MPWFLGDRRPPERTQGWAGRIVSSVSLLPLPLLAIFFIIILFLSLSKYTDYGAQMNQIATGFHLLFFLLPVILIVSVQSMFVNGRFIFELPRLNHDLIHQAGNLPWGVVCFVVLLLGMISYQSSFSFQWFRPL